MCTQNQFVLSIKGRTRKKKTCLESISKDRLENKSFDVDILHFQR